MSFPVVLDTNVLVSAGMRMGSPPAQVVEVVLLMRAPVFTCPAIEVEYHDVLGRPKFRKYGFPPPWFDLFLARAFQQADPSPWPLTGPDADDLVFLALAHATRSVLVTGNTDDYPVQIRRGVTVMTPREWAQSA